MMYYYVFLDNMNDIQFPTVSNKDLPSGRVSVRASCYRSMRKHEKPHDLRVGRKIKSVHRFKASIRFMFWGFDVARVGNL